MTDTAPDERSVAERLARKLAALEFEQRQAFIASLPAGQLEVLLHDWRLWRRPKQATPEGDWRIWMILAGRGFGKTRTGAEFIREQVESGTSKHIALVGATAADVRDTMIEGESGLLKVFPNSKRPRYEPSKRRVTFHNGAVAMAYAATEPDRLRGPNHDLAWADELAAWRYQDAWDQLMLGLRIGKHPRAVVTTTPRPIGTVRKLLKVQDGSVVTTRGSTYENKKNLAPAFMDEMLRRYEGTRLGRQELHAEVLDDTEGALWNRDLLEANRVTDMPSMKRIVVAIDPAVSNLETSAETGIIVAGLGIDGHGYVLEDCSMRGSPTDWATTAVAAYHRFKADRIIAEANQGGDMIRTTIEAVERNTPVKLVHASRGKRTRAEPISALYEQHRVHHQGFLPELEEQLCSWVPDLSPSPDRLDALVWALTELLVDGARRPPAVAPVSFDGPSPWRIS
jgi:phage terminase large subunit-like protein